MASPTHCRPLAPRLSTHFAARLGGLSLTLGVTGLQAGMPLLVLATVLAQEQPSLAQTPYDVAPPPEAQSAENRQAFERRMERIRQDLRQNRPSAGAILEADFERDAQPGIQPSPQPNPQPNSRPSPQPNLGQNPQPDSLQDFEQDIGDPSPSNPPSFSNPGLRPGLNSGSPVPNRAPDGTRLGDPNLFQNPFPSSLPTPSPNLPRLGETLQPGFEQAFGLYRLGPGDVLFVNVQRFPDLNLQGAINPQGAIVLPLAGTVQLEGLTVADAQARIRTALDRYIVNPQVDLSLLSQRPVRVTLVGKVASPGYYPLSTPAFPKRCAWLGAPRPLRTCAACWCAAASAMAAALPSSSISILPW